MDSLVHDFSFLCMAAYAVFILTLVTVFLCRTVLRCKRQAELDRLRAAKRERDRQEMVRFFVGCARDRSYRETVS